MRDRLVERIQGMIASEVDCVHLWGDIHQGEDLLQQVLSERGFPQLWLGDDEYVSRVDGAEHKNGKLWNLTGRAWYAKLGTSRGKKLAGLLNAFEARENLW